MPNPELLCEWQPLDTPAPECIAPKWDGPHFGKRLAEALRTLRHMPMNGYPAGFTNSWPVILHEYSDRAGCEDDPVWKAERAAESNWTRPRPSLDRDRADGNGDRLAGALPGSRPAAVSHGEGCGAWRKLGLPGRLARRWNREGLDLIAAGPRRDAVAVF
jgi:hypothetical protein